LSLPDKGLWDVGYTAIHSWVETIGIPVEGSCLLTPTTIILCRVCLCQSDLSADKSAVVKCAAH